MEIGRGWSLESDGKRRFLSKLLGCHHHVSYHTFLETRTTSNNGNIIQNIINHTTALVNTEGRIGSVNYMKRYNVNIVVYIC